MDYSRMKITFLLLPLIIFFPSAALAENHTHLFILSGQSNMVGVNPEESFTQTINYELANDNNLVVKVAMGARPLKSWFQAYPETTGHVRTIKGVFYRRIISSIEKISAGIRPDTVTLVWMQGEKDARLKTAGTYRFSFLRFLESLKEDLDQQQIGLVIGRLSDYGFSDPHYPDWAKMRNVQEQIVREKPFSALVDTDDLNDFPESETKPRDRLHYTRAGDKILGERFAKQASKIAEELVTLRIQ